MSGNSLGQIFKVTSFGESHGPAIGVVVDGIPSGVHFDENRLNHFLQRRKPGQNQYVTSRNESDTPEILSGVYEGKTLGTPIAVIVHNEKQRSQDYKDLKPRKGHADQTWLDKYGHVDLRGGGRSSGRETLARVIAGAIAEMVLEQIFKEKTPEVVGFAYQIGPESIDPKNFLNLSRDEVDKSPIRFPGEKSTKVQRLLADAKTNGESYGGSVCLVVRNMPQSLGEPVFLKAKNVFANAYMSIGATSSVSLGLSDDVTLPGTQFHGENSSELVYGGIQGGLTTGDDMIWKIGVKPTSSILDVAKKGRHDPCIVPRIIPVLEAMTSISLLDLVLLNRCSRV